MAEYSTKEQNKRMGSKAKTTQSFIDDAREVHGDSYDYSEVKYVNNKTKVRIKCNKCGHVFEMTPANHLCWKQGCPNCYGTHKKTTEQFIEEAKAVHGNKYDYSKVDYANTSTKVCIICHEKDENGEEHGEFWQTPHKHLSKRGCPKCANRVPISFEKFLERARKMHGDKYLYDKSKYAGYQEKTDITCPKHGVFRLEPSLHVANKIGCKQCWCERRGESTKLPFSEFVRRAREVHGDKYEYHEDKYKSYTIKTLITCPEHGDFWQNPQKHTTSKQGCPICAQSHLEEEMSLFLKNNGIKHIYQAGKETLPLLDRQRLDFYLPDYNIAIECQGKQHFGSKDSFFGDFEIIEEADKRKFSNVEKSGAKMVYFTHNTSMANKLDFYKDKIIVSDVQEIKKHLTL